MKKVKAQLLAHAKTKEEKDLFHNKVVSASEVLERVIEIISVKREQALSEQEDKKGYADASWPMMQADRIGYRRAIKEVIDLISLTGD